MSEKGERDSENALDLLEFFMMFKNCLLHPLVYTEKIKVFIGILHDVQKLSPTSPSLHRKN